MNLQLSWNAGDAPLEVQLSVVAKIDGKEVVLTTLTEEWLAKISDECMLNHEENYECIAHRVTQELERRLDIRPADLYYAVRRAVEPGGYVTDAQLTFTA